MFDHDTYISPFSWRYGSDQMRQIWSELHRRRLMRRFWLSLAAAQQRAGLVSSEQVADLAQHVEQIDIGRAIEIEKEVRHDVMAEIRAFAEQAPLGGAILHWGATSADVTDNVDVLRQREGLLLLLDRLAALLDVIAARIDETAELPVMAHTHIQPAEPTTLGYRFAVYGQDLLESYQQLRDLSTSLRGKGLKGAVGTQASFVEILRDSQISARELEADVMADLDLPYFTIATQTYTRQQDLTVVQGLASLAASLHKFALDFRILQSPPFGEWAEPFGEKQVGSSAMPFKRNPINTENICSLARYVGSLPAVVWDNAGQAILERSLDDSANRRIIMAEAFLAIDEMLLRCMRIIRDMSIDRQAIERNMSLYGPYAATERILMAAVAAGADRQEVHEWLRENSLLAWEAMRSGPVNPLPQLLVAEERLRPYLAESEIAALMDVADHTGTAAERAGLMAQTIREKIGASLT